MSSGWSDRLRHALGFRLALWYAVLFVGSSLAVIGLTYVLLASSLEQRDREIIGSTLGRYATEYQAGGLPALDRAISADRALSTYEPLFVRVLGRGAVAVFFSVPADWRRFDLDQLATPELRGARAWAEVPSTNGDAVLEVASVRLFDGTLFQVGKSTEVRAALLRRFRRALLLVLLSIVAIGLVGGTTLTYSALQPLRRLLKTVRGIEQTGQLTSRVTVRNTGDPIDELSVVFNRMLDRIDGLIAAMRGSLDNVAHDLRTPMTRLRAIAETALQGPPDPAAYRQALGEALEESDRMTSMLETLMDISEAETGTMKLSVSGVRLSDIVEDAVDLYAELADDKRLAIIRTTPADLVVTADRDRLRQVVANLMDNAVKYTPEGGRIELQARQEHDQVVLVVRDTGIGIPPEELPRIWDRLYRGDKSRSERGLGLGLSLVKAIVEAHRGRVSVTSDVGRGTTFTLTLPAGPPTPPPDAPPPTLSQM